MEDSHRESMRLDGRHEQAVTRPLPPDGTPGRPAVFSDAAIQFCLTIKVLFKLRLRQTTALVASLLKMAKLDWAVPGYTTLCRWQRTLAVQNPLPARQ